MAVGSSFPKGQVVGQTNDKTKSRRAPAKTSERAPRFNDARFVQYELDEEQIRQCKSWSLDGDNLWMEVLGLCDDGYSLTLRFDAYSNAYACFVQVRGDDQHPNAGFILTGRGSTPSKAVKQALFKHRAVDASWSGYAERRSAVLDD